MHISKIISFVSLVAQSMSSKLSDHSSRSRNLMIDKIDKEIMLTDELAGVVVDEAGLGRVLCSPEWSSQSWNCSNGTPTTDKMCSWEGISCDQQGIVNALSCTESGAELTGTIPSSIGLLTSLSAITLSSCSIFGTLPTSIGFLTNLQDFKIINCPLSGHIPDEIGLLKQITYLQMSNLNNLSGKLPETFGSMTLINTLMVSYSKISGAIPTCLGSLTSLTLLYLNSNALSSSIPTEIGLLIALRSMDLFRNSLVGVLPTSMGQLTALYSLGLSNNKFSDVIPSFIGNLTSLTALSLNFNALVASIPTSIGWLTGLHQLYLSNNCLSGAIPSSIGYLTALTGIALGNNRLTSSIPTSIGQLNSLNILWLSSNKLSGLIPSSIGNLTSLFTLSLRINNLQGSIPTTIGSLSMLIDFLLGYNKLSSSIPTSIGLLHSVKFLNLNNNKLSSSIPTTMSHLTNLYLLALEFNSLSGMFPMDVCMPKLGYISMSNNNLSCVPWCQDDFDWAGKDSGSAVLPRCQDFQDKAVFDISSKLEVPLMLQTLSSMQASSRVIQSPHPYPLFTDLHINDIYAHQYEVVMSAFEIWGYLLFCLDPTCAPETVIGVYGSLSGSYGGVFGWLIPADAESLVIKAPSFFLMSTLDNKLCPSIGGNAVCGYAFGFKFTLTTRLRIPTQGWEFTSPPQLLPLNSSSAQTAQTPSMYAQGLCQSEWQGITCDKGLITGLHLSGLGLRGTLPSSLGLLTGLTALDLSANRIGGSVLSSIGMLSNLGSLYLNQNNFEGTLPNTITSIPRLYDVSLSNNKLTGSVPTLFDSLTSLEYLLLDGNSFNGEVSSDICDMLTTKNVTVTLTNNPHLTCYQELCWGNVLTGQRLFDSTLKMCVPTSVPTTSPSSLTPTSNPSREPTRTHSPSLSPSLLPSLSPSMPSPFPSNKPTAEPSLTPSVLPTASPTSKPTPTSSPTTNPTAAPSAVIIKPLLTTNQIIALSVALSVSALLLAVYIIYRECFSPRALYKKAKLRRLNELPVHRVLYDLKNETEADLLSIIETYITTVSEKDIDGRTALDIILFEKKKVSRNVVCILLQKCLPLDVTTGEKIEQSDRFSSWIQAVQSDEDNVVFAVERVLHDYKRHIVILTRAQDAAGRSCLDIASKRCKAAMYRLVYLNGRFELRDGPAVHKSATSLVIYAMDHWGGNGEGVIEGSGKEARLVQVALKFMRNKEQFDREVKTRTRGALDSKYVVGMLDAFDEDHVGFRGDAVLKGYGEYPYCIVLEAGDSNLKQIVDAEYLAGREWAKIREMTLTLTEALDHFHHRNILHGDLKPQNILRVGFGLKLIDMDASASFADGAKAGSKYSSGYIAPEMFWIHDGEIRVRSQRCFEEVSSPIPGSTVKRPKVNEVGNEQHFTHISVASQPTPNPSNSNANPTDVLIDAHPSQDMWALGCVLYYLCTGISLFHVNTEDNITLQDEMYTLYYWSPDIMKRKLSLVQDHLVRNLLSLLLSKDPKNRPSAARVLSHPFLTGRRGSRLQGEEATWDVFLSYRVSSDVSLAEDLYKALTALGLRVWWDKVCLLPGQNWEEGFCRGITSSANFVCLASRGAMKSPTNDIYNWEKHTETSRCDSLLLEWRLALDLKERGMLDGIFPVMIGDKDAAGVYGEYNRGGCRPSPGDVVVASVEAKVREHLDRESLGTPYIETMSVKAIFETVMINQGGKITGSVTNAINMLGSTILKMIIQTPQLGPSTIGILKGENADLKRDLEEYKAMIAEYKSKAEAYKMQVEFYRASSDEFRSRTAQQDLQITILHAMLDTSSDTASCFHSRSTEHTMSPMQQTSPSKRLLFRTGSF